MKYVLKPFDIAVNVSKIANIHYFEFLDGYHTIEDRHGFCELLYVDRGTITVHSENYSGVLSDNQLMIHRPDETHYLECNVSNTPNVIVIGFECDNKGIEVFAKEPVTLSAEHKSLLSAIINEGIKVFAPPYDLPNTPEMVKREEYPFAADQLIKLYLETLLIFLVRSRVNEQQFKNGKVVSDSKIEAVHQYISEHYTEKITLENLCFLFRTNKTTLCKDFKNAYGMTILNYVNKLRIDEAKALIRRNELSITEISDKLGFESIHYFCKLFKKVTNQSAKEYFKSIRSKLDL